MSPMAQPNIQLICKGWKEVYKSIYASSHSRCEINVKKFKENLNFFCCKKESLNHRPQDSQYNIIHFATTILSLKFNKEQLYRLF